MTRKPFLRFGFTCNRKRTSEGSYMYNMRARHEPTRQQSPVERSTITGDHVYQYQEIVVHSRGTFYAENLTDRIREIVRTTGIRNGTVTCMVQHTTCALLLMEHEMGVLLDIRRVLDSLVPEGMVFAHHLRNVDTNGRAHVLGALFNSTIDLPVVDGTVVSGEYQDLVFLDFQHGMKSRAVGVHVQGAPCGTP